MLCWRHIVICLFMIQKNTRGPIKINKINMSVASGRNAGPVPGNNLLSPVLQGVDKRLT